MVALQRPVATIAGGFIRRHIGGLNIHLDSRGTRREFTYEAVLASGRQQWSVGERVRVYRTQGGAGGVVPEYDGESTLNDSDDSRDYDVEYYARSLLQNFASRLARAFTPADFDAIFADPDQLLLFVPRLEDIRPILVTSPILP